MATTIDETLGDVRRVENLLAQSNFDAVIAVSPDNVRYVGDVHISTQTSIRDRLALVIWPKGRDPVFVVCLVEEGYVRATSWIKDVRSYKEFVVKPMDLVADVLTELGLANAHIGAELDYLAALYADHLRERLPGLKLSQCTDLFLRARMFKTPRELAILRNAYRSTEKALLSTYATVRVGETEKSMANRLADALMHTGADMVAYLHINAGANTGYPHMSPGDYRVQAGDIVKADVGAWYSEYITNIGRTAKVGEPTAEDQSYWTRLRDIHHRLIDMVRPGNTGSQLFAAAGKLYAAADLPFPYAHNGHGVGLLVHEHPLISPHDDTPFEPGMVTTVETRVRWVGKVGYHMEDLIEITDGAPVLMSDAFDNERIFVI
ncbi:MAG: M24 family metallopeptidase [Burkholderiales bacterium]